jgi:hypothetical protein
VASKDSLMLLLGNFGLRFHKRSEIQGPLNVSCFSISESNNYEAHCVQSDFEIE